MSSGGVVFPKDQEGNRKTSEIGKMLLAESTRVASQDFAKRVLDEKKWRFKYNKYFVEHVEISAQSPENALKIARAGLAKVHEVFEFEMQGKCVPFKNAMESDNSLFVTGVIKGDKPKPAKFELEVQYGEKKLKGSELEVQVEKWVRNGTIELSCGNAIIQVSQQSNWLDLSNRYFVLLGAAAAMGPLDVLLSLGANVIAIDINRPAVWNRLITRVKNSCGTLIFPATKELNWAAASVDDISNIAGCDLLTQTPEIKNWLLKCKPDQPLVVGAYAYLDSDLFVRLSVAMDGIIDHLTRFRKNVALAYLCTPTDCHLIPAAAYDAQVNAFRRESLWMSLLRVLSRGSWCAKNARKPIQTKSGEQFHMVDAIIPDQGPNYLLAKRIQHWRAMVARDDQKLIVSSNVAPSTATISVTKNRSFAWAYAGMHNFKPMEVFKQETSNSVMTALLLNDINNPTSAAQPTVPLSNPLQLFSHTSFHGGPWRTAHRFSTIGAPSALLHFVSLFVNFYLSLYNGVQSLGWLAVLVNLAPNAESGVWTQAGPLVTIFQSLMALEIAHSFFGFVSAPVFSTAIQVLSRLFVLGVVLTNPVTHTEPALHVMLFAWALTETVRYSFFTLRQLGLDNSVLKWLRYSLFIVLYPLGVYGELATTYRALPTMHETLNSFDLTNAGFATSFYVHTHRLVERYIMDDVSKWTLYVIFPSYAFGLPFLYLHLLSQRSKNLAPKAKRQAKH